MHLNSNIALEQGLLGGVVLGLSSSALMLLHARINGLSSIVKATVQPDGEDWQKTYSVGLVSAGLIASKVYPALLPQNTEEGSISIPLVVLAGLLVGYGTKISGGCTSGHGLCGLSRWSPRSLVAVATFMTTGAISAAFSRSSMVQNFSSAVSSDFPIKNHLFLLIPSIAVLGLSSVYHSDVSAKQQVSKKSPLLAHFVAIGCSLTFGLGLILSQMVDPARVQNFLDFSNAEHGWDPSLMGVMGGGVAVIAITYPLMKSVPTLRSLTEGNMVCDAIKIGAEGPNMVIDAKLVTGATLFGLGWGLAGICPGPAMVMLGAGSIKAAVFVPAMLLAMMVRLPNM
jgi:uncharacterized membrane protein YedE/YeeE